MSEYVQDMMYVGTRLIPVADVVAMAMEAEDSSVVTYYVQFLLSHAFDTYDQHLRNQCDEIRCAHGWRPYKGPPASVNNLSRQPSDERPVALMPRELCTDRACELWERLRKAGFIVAGGYALAEGVSNNQATYIASVMAECLKIKDKWKVFQQLWGIKNMAQLAGTWQQTGKLPPRHKEISRLLK